MILRLPICFGAVALGWGCTTPSTPKAPATRGTVAVTEPFGAGAVRRKRPMPPSKFVPGPRVRPAATLLAWLKKTARRRIRLPVVIRFGKSVLRTRGDAFIGASPEDLGPSSIFLRLEDGAMGISLRTRLRSQCPRQRSWCAVWLEGTWGPLLRRPLLPAGGGARNPRAPWPFSVRSVVGTVKALEKPADLRALVRAPSR